MRRHMLAVVLYLLLGIAMSACTSSPPPETEPTPTDTPSDTQTYPNPGSAASPAQQPTSPYPGGEAPPTSTPAVPPDATPPPIPTAGTETGVVHGILLSAATQEPLTPANATAVMYLSPLVTGTNEDFPIAVLDKEISPTTLPGMEGIFVFLDVPPGEYLIVVETPLNQVAARSVDDVEYDLVVNVVAGEVIDVGRIYIPYP